MAKRLTTKYDEDTTAYLARLKKVMAEIHNDDDNDDDEDNICEIEMRKISSQNKKTVPD